MEMLSSLLLQHLLVVTLRLAIDRPSDLADLAFV